MDSCDTLFGGSLGAWTRDVNSKWIEFFVSIFREGPMSGLALVSIAQFEYYEDVDWNESNESWADFKIKTNVALSLLVWIERLQ